MNKNILLALLITSLFANAFPQTLTDKIFDDSIKTVYIHLKGDPLSYPVMRMNTQDRLVLEFDDLNTGNKPGNYQYTFIHCDENWNPSDLLYDEYIEGFEENYADKYDFSFNTLANYIHYEIEFPNNDVKFLKSGNYIIKVYRNYDTSQLVLQKRFVVVEQIAEISGQVHIASLSQYRLSYQEVDFNVSTELTLKNPLEYVKAAIIQNLDWRTTKFLKPNFIQGKTLIYNYEKENLFLAGNEYRVFITKNTSFNFPQVEKIELIPPYYHFILRTDAPLTKYFFINDINGKFYIVNEKAHDSRIEADYVYVHFFLFAPVKYSKDVYIYGQLSNWEYDPKFKMNYDPNSGYYYKKILLKQGIYNYTYRLYGDKANTIDGNFSDTRNDYIIIIYYYDVAQNYYRAIGFAILQS